MIEKIAQDIINLTNIKLAGFADLFEKNAANVFGVTPNNFQLNMFGNPQLHKQVIQNISAGKVSLPQVQKFFSYMNHPNNTAFKANATKSGLYSAVSSFLSNPIKAAKPSMMSPALQTMNNQRVQQAVQRSRVGAATNGIPYFGNYVR